MTLRLASDIALPEMDMASLVKQANNSENSKESSVKEGVKVAVDKLVHK
ncbi:MAG: hypothetical protein MK212_22040 [Saprospiraceae bacterium]|nr:hypothetical protein [Saprospiraceae bacterium]